MRICNILPAILALTAMPVVAAAQEPTVAQVVDKIIAQEQAEVQSLRGYSPLVETYIQFVRPDKELGAVPDGDRYFLGRAELAKGVELEPLINGPSGFGKQKILNTLGSFFSTEFLPGGFLQMIYLDTDGFDRQHYKFTYGGREFLGEVRCLIFDVDPLPNSGKGRFSGRIWVEDRDYHVVRFNGAYGGSSKSSYYFNFDSWLVNSSKNEWLPAYVYSEEGNVEYGLARHAASRAFKAQTRLWGYDLNRPQEEQMLGSISIEAPKINDQAQKGNGYSPLQARRAWGRLAEDNVAAKMQATGLLAPYGDVDRVLETVINNLEVTSELDIQPEVRCRVLMTSTLESFTIGHTIVISRGLIDVLPDEASLATMLTQELADLILTKPSTDQWGFNDTTNVSTVEALSHFSFKDTPEDMQRAGEKAVELLKNSPYKDKLGSAGLFLKQLAAESKALPALISPHIGNRVFISDQLLNAGPALAPDKLDQIAALPIGARLKLDPWSDRVQLLKAKPVALLSAREKMPFELTPFEPFLTRYEKQDSAGSPDQGKPDVAKQQQQSVPPQQQ